MSFVRKHFFEINVILFLCLIFCFAAVTSKYDDKKEKYMMLFLHFWFISFAFVFCFAIVEILPDKKINITDKGILNDWSGDNVSM